MSHEQATHLVLHKPTSKAYLTLRSGDRVVLNSTGAELLLNSPTYLQLEAHSEFRAKLSALGYFGDNLESPKVVARNVSTPYHLKRVQLELLLACNLRCGHCYCESGPGKSAGMETESAKKLIQEAADLGVLNFDFTGGEPLLREDLFELAAFAKSLGLRCSVFTNGTLATPEIAKKLRESGVLNVQCSIDGFSERTHDALRGQKNALKRAIEGIRNLKRESIYVSVTVMVNRYNVGELRELRSFLANDLKVDFRLDRVIPAGRAKNKGDRVALSAEEYFYALRTLFPEGISTRKVCDASDQNSTDFLEPGCGVGWSYAFIKHDGYVALCPTLTRHESPEFETRRLDNGQGLKEIWENDPTFKKFRGIQCRNISICPTATTCRGGCRSNAYLLHHDVRSPEELSCNTKKNPSLVYRQFLAEYAT